MTANDMIMALAEAVQPIVAAIEAQPAVTKDRYDQYMSAIERVRSSLQAKPKTAALAVAVAMTYAGGNREGIKQAMIALGYML